VPCALMWATAWRGDANRVIAPLGLPELPVAELPDAPEEYEAGVLKWKTMALVRVADLALVADRLRDLRG
jgi:hypothetical protein